MYLQLSHVSKEMDQNQILKDISIQCKRGKIYGFKGKNGSGKTMLMRIICGLVKPTEGSVTVDGVTLGKKHNFPESVGVLIEAPGFIGNYSGYQNLKVLAEIQGKIGKKEIEEVMAEVGLDPAEKKKTKKYSLGMKQKLGIAAAVMENPDLIILDEPTNALDEEGVKNLHSLLKKHKEAGALILISSHDKEELEYLSDVLFFMENGTIKDIKNIESEKREENEK
ncbi:ATP-binding cassette domain-containing protein [bacterium D16-51]|nr:ATP-binding cassette domain-containing protein [bacterium D16-59]RKI60804.1 ATP-binding cassette domain-containing protein [bacterium D16-51]